MSSGDIYRAKAELLLKQATHTANMAERSNLIGEAVRWHMMAREADGLEEVVRTISWFDPDRASSDAAEEP